MSVRSICTGVVCVLASFNVDNTETCTRLKGVTILEQGRGWKALQYWNKNAAERRYNTGAMTRLKGVTILEQ
jgi:predicted type IV restriction endonuclease